MRDKVLMGHLNPSPVVSQASDRNQNRCLEDFLSFWIFDIDREFIAFHASNQRKRAKMICEKKGKSENIDGDSFLFMSVSSKFNFLLINFQFDQESFS